MKNFFLCFSCGFTAKIYANLWYPFALRGQSGQLLLLFFFILMLVIFRMVDETEVNTFNSQSSSLIKLNNGTVLYLREVNKFLALVCILREENFQKQGQSLNIYIRHLSCEGLNVFLKFFRNFVFSAYEKDRVEFVKLKFMNT